MADSVLGSCDPRFAAAREAFAAGLAEELGCRFTVCLDGRVVVDLMGGFADRARTRPFGPETLTPVYSTGKAVMALMIARLVEQGRLDYDQRVAELWPEFGQAGKDRITVGQLMSHQAGLPGFDHPVDPAIWFDPPAVLEALCAQAPMWPPGTASGYHPITIGYLAGELFRRVDGRSLGTALREDLCGPFGLDLWIGLPDAEHGRVADIQKPSSAPDLGILDAVKRAAFLDRGSAPGGRGSTEWRRMEIPSANAHATAPALARLMAVIACGGRLDAKHVLSGATLDQATRPRITGQDKVLPFRLSWAAGLLLNTGLGFYGANPHAAGHSGWGGSCVFADPAQRLSGAYVMNKQSSHLLGDPRAVRLIESVYAAL